MNGIECKHTKTCYPKLCRKTLKLAVSDEPFNHPARHNLFTLTPNIHMFGRNICIFNKQIYST